MDYSSLKGGGYCVSYVAASGDTAAYVDTYYLTNANFISVQTSTYQLDTATIIDTSINETTGEQDNY